MIFSVVVYLMVFAISVFAISVFEKTYKNVRIVKFSSESKYIGGVLYCIFGCIMLFPVISMYSLRYGIGTDYFSYESIYDAIHKANFIQYWIKHVQGIQYFYVEPGYYWLNKLSPNYRCLLVEIGILIFALFCLSVKNYSSRIRIGFALAIFLCTQFIYSLNGMRFSISLMFVLLSYEALIENKNIKFLVLIIIASLFHKTALICIAMYFLKRYKHREVNSTRNIFLLIFIILFPVISDFLLQIASSLNVFQRYFSVAQYSRKVTMSGGWKWMLHVIPVILPLILFCKKEIFNAEDTQIYFRICIMEIPFRMLGLYNTWYTRLARYSQIVQMIFIPLVIGKIKNRATRRLLYIYYIVWYSFYFAYYAIVNDQCDSLPYSWIFSI